MDSAKIVDLASRIVASYVQRNVISPGDLLTLTRSVHSALSGLSNGARDEIAADLKPAVPVRKSVTDDWIICLEDGKKFKSLKRHLRSAFNMSPDEYRKKWGLPPDYPIVAPNYSLKRSGLAKDMGLGTKAGSKRTKRGRKS